MAFRERLVLGQHVFFDGEIHKVEEIVRGSLKLRSKRGQVSLVDLASLVTAEDFKLLDVEGYEEQDLTTFPDNIPKALLDKAGVLLKNLLEAKTGYKSGRPDEALEHEPREMYDPSFTTLNQRMEAKAAELKMTPRNLWMRKKAYEQRGIVGLVDQRSIKNSDAFATVDLRIREAVNAVFDELEQRSNVSKDQVRRKVERWLGKTYPDEEIKLPSKPTFNRLLDAMDLGRGIFGPAKRRRENANRPVRPFRKFTASRSGQIIIIDTTTLDAFALDPLTFKWVQIQLTVALDLYTRSLLLAVSELLGKSSTLAQTPTHGEVAL